ncbi:unnamed protein product [Linum trigynum]|uniref:CCHC-type domain-containing protein n=1 Tax=Linum trigynum TaxID=586398 RepID=A0AAV2G8V8_9ROSI
MDSGESIHHMYSRFTSLINQLKGLGKTLPSTELNRKILRTLPKEWLPKRTAIDEAKDLQILSVDELIGSLMSYEHVIQQVARDDNKRARNLAFKSQTFDCDSDSEANIDFEKEFALVSRKFHQMLKYKNEQKKPRRCDTESFNSYDHNQSISQDRLLVQQTRVSNAGTQEKEPQACYKCGKNGHIRAKCPRSSKSKERRIVATWSDCESRSDIDKINEEAYMAFSIETEIGTSITNQELSLKSDHIEVQPYAESSKVNSENFLYVLKNLEDECRSLKIKCCCLQEEVRKKAADVVNLTRTIELNNIKFVELQRENDVLRMDKDRLYKLLEHKSLSAPSFGSKSNIISTFKEPTKAIKHLVSRAQSHYAKIVSRNHSSSNISHKHNRTKYDKKRTTFRSSSSHHISYNRAGLLNCSACLQPGHVCQYRYVYSRHWKPILKQVWVRKKTNI